MGLSNNMKQYIHFFKILTNVLAVISFNEPEEISK